MLQFGLNDIIRARVDIWNPWSCSFIKEGKQLTITHLDDVILLPSPEKWQKIIL